MQVSREQCSLILDRNSLTYSDGHYTGMFFPVRSDGVNAWLDKFTDYVSKNKIGMPVEFGPCYSAERNPRKRLEQHMSTDLTKSGLFITKCHGFNLNERVGLRGFTFEFALHGPYAGLTKVRLEEDVPFIIACKTLTDDHYNGDVIVKSVTEVVGLQLLLLEQLAVPVGSEMIDLCSLPAEPLFIPAPQCPETPCINKNDFTKDEIILGNRDLEMAVTLNLAAGNFIPHENKDIATPSHYEANLKRQIGIDMSECFELLEAYIKGDVSLLRDALADKRVTLNGFQPILPFSMIEDYRSAINNNFTRFDSTYERALETQEKYRNLNVETEISTVILVDKDDAGSMLYFVNKVAKDCTGTNGEIYSKGKWVKSKYFTNDAFENIDGLFTEKTVDEKAQSITQRYLDTRAMVKALLKGLDQQYTKAISDLVDDEPTGSVEL